jgi:4,5-DOPA dioxygenase extradiol
MTVAQSPGAAAMTDQQATEKFSDRMPVIFAGHGSPMNAIEQNRWSDGFASLAGLTPRPKAILAISAHWYVDGTWLTGNAKPPTIHDFSGFPEALYGIQYPSPGNAELAEQVRRLLGTEIAALESGWGLDHGTWSVLRWMYPAADVPVIQLSIDRQLDPSGHFRLAQSLAELRDEGVLILASGNLVHNLRDAFARKHAGSDETPDWAQRYDEAVTDILQKRDTDALLKIWPDTDDGRIAHPTPDHWLPMIYAYGATDDRDQVRIPAEGFDWGSISMRNVVFG